MTEIHPTAIVADGASIGSDVLIGPYCVIGSAVVIGAGTKLISHVVVDGNTAIGGGCTIFPFACIGMQTQDLKFRGAKTFVRIGDRTTIREYVTVNSGTNEGETTSIGDGCHIMAYSHIAHACSVGNGVIMANCATLAGDVTVEDGAGIGGLSAVHQFVRIGKHCYIGGCTKITQDCPPFMIVDGNPAVVRGINKVGLTRKNIDERVQKILKEAYRYLYRKEMSTTQATDAISKELETCDELDYLISFIEKSERGIIK